MPPAAFAADSGRRIHFCGGFAGATSFGCTLKSNRGARSNDLADPQENNYASPNARQKQDQCCGENCSHYSRPGCELLEMQESPTQRGVSLYQLWIRAAQERPVCVAKRLYILATEKQ
jgi:hypothetical protein